MLMGYLNTLNGDRYICPNMHEPVKNVLTYKTMKCNLQPKVYVW